MPSGRLNPGKALVFAIAISVAGFVELWFGANPLAASLGLFTLLSYLFVYTPLKQRSPHSTTIGAIPGAMPPLHRICGRQRHADVGSLGSVCDSVPVAVPAFLRHRLDVREDYERAGIRMLPVVEPDGESTARRILLYSLALIPISLVPKFLCDGGQSCICPARWR